MGTEVVRDYPEEASGSMENLVRSEEKKLLELIADLIVEMVLEEE